MSLTVYIWVLPEPGLVWIMPRLLLSMPTRSGRSSEAFSSAECCRWQLSVPVQEPLIVFPQPYLAQAAGHHRGELCREMSPWGGHGMSAQAWGTGRVLLEGSEHFFLPRTAHDHGVSILQRVAPFGVPAPAMGSIFSFLTQRRLPKSRDRATETEWNCSICRDARDDLTYVVPCLHQFCLACIMRWAEMQRVCPLCREQIEGVRFSVQTDSYIDCVFTSSEESANASSWTGITLGQLVKNSPFVESPSRAPRRILPTAEHGGTGTEPVGGLLPSVWAELFQREEHLLDPVVPWLRQELEAKYGNRWWMARIAESIILHAVSICGPARNVLAHVLQDFLEEHTETLIHGIINIIVNQCTQEAQRLLQSRAVPENNPAAISSRFQMDTTAPHPTPASSPAGSSEEHQLGTSEAVLHTLHPSAPTPAEQEELGEEAVAEELATEEDNSTVAISISPQEDNLAPQAAPASSPSGSRMEDHHSTSEAVLHTPHPPTPVPAEQEELEPAAATGPSAQGSSHSPSAPSQGRGRDPLPRRPQRSTRRRAASCLDSPQPCKRPPDQQQ